MQFASASEAMRYAVDCALRGVGHVEPNPPVGALLVDADWNLLAEGYHTHFGGPHAERHCLERWQARGEPLPTGSRLIVTLEPCCHHGKTPPCTAAILAAGITHVIVGTRDPARHTEDTGCEQLTRAGVTVEVGVNEEACQDLIAPFEKRTTRQQAYVHAKWAMSFDGAIATREGHSQWISSPASRQLVHQLRGRMDVICVGLGTVLADDPLLTARPPGPRVPLRMIVSSSGRLPLTSRIVQTCHEFPTLLVTTDHILPSHRRALEAAGVEVMLAPQASLEATIAWPSVLGWLSERGVTNLLVEGGGEVLGSLHDQNCLDEVHLFVAPQLIGGATAVHPVAGVGLARVPSVANLRVIERQVLEQDLYLRARVRMDVERERHVGRGD